MSAIWSVQVSKIARIAGIILVIYAVISVWLEAHRFAGVDFYQYWLAPRLLIENAVESIYSPASDPRRLSHNKENLKSPRYTSAAEFRSKFLRLSSSPLLYTFTSNFSHSNYDLSLDLFRGAAVLASLLALLLLCNMSGFSISGTCLLISCYFLWFEPLQSDLRVGNINQFQLLSVALGLWFLAQRRSVSAEFAAGVVFGVTILLKPNVILIAPALLLAWLGLREYKRIAVVTGGTFIGIALGAVVPLTIFNTMYCWSEWMGVALKLPDQAKFIYPLSVGNYSLNTLALKLIGGELPGAYGLLFLFPALFLIYRGGMKRIQADQGERNKFEFLTVGLALLASLLASPVVWSHYYLLLLPLITFTFADFSFRFNSSTRGWIPLLLAMPWLFSRIGVGLRVIVASDLLNVCMFIVASLMLFCISLCNLLRVPRKLES